MPVALRWLREEVSSSVKGPPEPAESERRMISPGRRGGVVTVEHCLKKTCVMLRMVTSQPMKVVDKTFKRDLGKL
jgi:hypothetical protein